MLSFTNLRKHHKYTLVNFGEKTRFVVLELLGDSNCLVQSLDNLDKFELNSLIGYGLSRDYQLHEIEK